MVLWQGSQANSDLFYRPDKLLLKLIKIIGGSTHTHFDENRGQEIILNGELAYTEDSVGSC
jgi:hypothetical protein